MSKHTPGPWLVHCAHMTKPHDSPVAYADYRICSESCERYPHHAEADANALLIAALPELLEAAKLAHDVLWNGYKPGSDAWERARKACLNGLIKAGGVREQT